MRHFRLARPHVLAAALAAAVATTTTGAAQDHVLPPDTQIAWVVVDNLPALQRTLPGTALGRLLATPDMQTAVREMRAHWNKVRAPIEDLRAMARRYGVLNPDEVAWHELTTTDPADIQGFGAWAWLGGEGNFQHGATLMALEPTPKAQGRTAHRLHQAVQDLARSKNFTAIPGERIGSYPAEVFQPPLQGEEPWWRSQQLQETGWFLTLPGQICFGTGEREGLRIGPPPVSSKDGEVRAGVGFGQYIAQFRQFGMAANAPFAAMGIDDVGDLAVSMRFHEGDVQLDARLTLGSPPHGLLGALAQPARPLLRQPVPDGALLQLRCHADVKGLADAVLAIARASDVPVGETGEVVQELQKALGGNLAVAVGEPMAGGLIPRLWCSLGIADQTALQGLLTRLPKLDEGVEVLPRKIGAQEIQVLKVPGMPAGLQPCWCVRDDVLHLAETVQSLRQLLRALDADGAPEAMDIGAAPPPGGEGTELAFELRHDGGLILQNARQTWLPALRLFAGAMAPNFGDTEGQQKAPDPLLDYALLPDAALLREHLGRGRAALRRVGNDLVYSSRSRVCDPLLLAGLLAAFEGFQAQQNTMRRYDLQQVRQAIGKAQLTEVGAALKRWQQTHDGGLPASLGDLLTAGLLKDPTLLLLPGEPAPEPIVWRDGQGTEQRARTSYLYRQKGLVREIHDRSGSTRSVKVIVLDWQASDFGRVILDHEGVAEVAWGEIASEEIGKADEKDTPDKK